MTPEALENHRTLLLVPTLGTPQTASEYGHRTLLGNFLDEAGHRKTKTNDRKALDFIFLGLVGVSNDPKQPVCKGLLALQQKRQNHSTAAFDVPSASPF